jgi:hypothetical protein
MSKKLIAALLSFALAGVLTGCNDTTVSAEVPGTTESINIADRLKETNAATTSETTAAGGGTTGAAGEIAAGSETTGGTAASETAAGGTASAETFAVTSMSAVDTSNAAVTAPAETAFAGNVIEFTAANPELTVTEGGNYIVKGSVTNGRLIVNAGANAVVTLTFSDVNITSERGPALRIRSAKSVEIILPKDTNSVLTSTTLDDDSAAISSFSDLTISGEGGLTLSSYGSGIESSRVFNMKGGALIVAKSEEGIEASQVNVSGGTISISSREDAVNVDGGYDTEKFNMTGGRVYINCGGDGLDSRIYISGGTLIIEGSTRLDNTPIDFERNFEISGGTVFTTGSTFGNCRTVFPTGGTQSFIAVNAAADIDDVITVKDSAGNEVASLISAKKTSVIFVSTSALKAGESYTVTVTDAQTGTVSSTVTVKAGEKPQAATTRPNYGDGYYDDDWDDRYDDDYYDDDRYDDWDDRYDWDD